MLIGPHEDCPAAADLSYRFPVSLDVAEVATVDQDAIAKLARACVTFAGRNPAFIRLMNDECKRRSPRMRWLVDRHGRPLYEATTKLLGRKRREGLLPDVPDVHLYYMFIGRPG